MQNSGVRQKTDGTNQVSEWTPEARKVVEEILTAMPCRDVTYRDDFIWCGNNEIEVWFFPDNSCIVSRGEMRISIDTRLAYPEIVEYIPEDSF